MLDHAIFEVLAEFEAERVRSLQHHLDVLHIVVAKQHDIFQRTVREFCPLEKSEKQGSCCGTSEEPPLAPRILPRLRCETDEMETTVVDWPFDVVQATSDQETGFVAREIEAPVSMPRSGTETDRPTASRIVGLTQQNSKTNTSPSVEIEQPKQSVVSTATEGTLERQQVKEHYGRIASCPKRRTLKLSTFGTRCVRCPRIERFVNGQVFECGTCVVIVLNACFIGYVVDCSVREAFENLNRRLTATQTQALALQGTWPLEVSFAVFFFLELCARLFVNQCWFFFGEDWLWNLSDSTVVLGSVAEVLLPSQKIDLSIVRLLRVLRIVRTFRLLRLLRFAGFLRDLRLMALAILKSMVPLLWASVFLVLLMFLFAVLFLQAVVTHVNDATWEDPTTETFRIFFDSLPMALLTLWMSVSGGVSWWEVADGLLGVSAVYCVCMVLFVLVMVVAVMNIMTGIFVNDALLMASMDRELVEQEQKARSNENIETLHTLFKEIDGDCTGKITLDEIQQIMDRKDVKAIFATVGLEVSNATSFFKLLDVDDSNSLEVDEFVVGCLRIRGMARAVDLQTLMYENKRVVKHIKEQQAGAAKIMSHFGQSLKKMTELLRTVAMRDQEDGHRLDVLDELTL
uniref:EF-hand domain-containing protein n=1 Tax=Noctiluca scintillans TaxID=2966 RepID=A0A7S1F9F9_NOCSC|mmetsp:Transcript_42266/g.111645  ORF Transcript_42266/g.111645 Transcript_42266/m.111645 type:complete len:629 (+) Transcript_42266:71-1957(+)